MALAPPERRGTTRTTPLSLVCYAAQSGGQTLDQGEGGGNPFASALIELLGRPSLTLAELIVDIVNLTSAKSGGFQVPDVPPASATRRWSVKPVPAAARRIALVFVYADYRRANVNSLPGAKRDMKRVAAALRKAGFVVKTVADPTSVQRRKALDLLATQSVDAEAAVIYTTGHGVEHDHRVYLMPSEHSFDLMMQRLPELGLHVPSLGLDLQAASANLVFFGGCRTLV